MEANDSADSKKVLTGYHEWLERQPLSANTKRTYRVKVRTYVEFLERAVSQHGNPLSDENARDYAVRDFKAHLKTTHAAKPSSLNLALAAVDHFYRFVGIGPPRVRREALPQAAPVALPRAAQISFLRAVERSPSRRDRAIALLLYHTGIRLGECVSLNVEDVPVSARKGKVVVRSGRGDTYREVDLNSEARRAVQAWLDDRKRTLGEQRVEAMFVNRRGGRLSTRSVHDIIRRLGRDAGLELSAHTLRHTCLTTLVRNGNDLVLVAEIAGHRRVETTLRYCLPTAADRRQAMDGLQIDY